MSIESEYTNYQIVFTTGGGDFTQVCSLLSTEGWTDEVVLQIAEALAGVSLPSGFSIQIDKTAFVQTDYTADTTVSPAVFD